MTWTYKSAPAPPQTTEGAHERKREGGEALHTKTSCSCGKDGCGFHRMLAQNRSNRGE